MAEENVILNRSSSDYEKAISFNGNQRPMNTGTYLYHNERVDANFVAILKSQDKIIMPHTKDLTGCSIINHNPRVKGYLFGSNVDNTTGEPPCITISPFGGHRILIPIKILAERMNNDFKLYVSEFATSKKGNRYLTLIMTESDSEVDKFCIEKQLKLLPKDNPFLKYSITKENFEVSGKTFVHVFYAKDIDLRDYEEKGIIFEPPVIVAKEELPEAIASLNTEPSVDVAKEELPEAIASLNIEPSVNVAKEKLPEAIASLNTEPSVNVAQEELPEAIASLNTEPPVNVTEEELPEAIASLDTEPPVNVDKEELPEAIASLNTELPINVDEEELAGTIASLNINQ